MRDLVYFVAASVDGFIADPAGGFDAFPTSGPHVDTLAADFPATLPTPALDAYGVPAQRRADPFDTVVMGWRTYALGLPMGAECPYAHLRQIVFSRAHLDAAVPSGVELVGDDPRVFVEDLKSQAGGDIWLCGGSQLAGALIGLVDRVVIKTYPVALGRGLPLFGVDRSSALALEHREHRWLAAGIAMNSYDVMH